MKFKTKNVFLGVSSHPAHVFIKNVLGVENASGSADVDKLMLMTNDSHKEIQDLIFYNKGEDTSLGYDKIFHMIKDSYIFSNRYIDFLTYYENIILRRKFLSSIGTALNINILRNELSKESYLFRMVLLGRSDKVSVHDWNIISSIANVACVDLDGFEEIPKHNMRRKYSCKMNVSEATTKISEFIFYNFSKKDIVYINDGKIMQKIFLSFLTN